MNTTTKITASKDTILAALYAFASQRPGLDFANYGDCRTYNAEARAIRKTLSEFRQLFRQVQLSDSITAENLIEAARSAFSGRLSFIQRGDSVAVDYCTGQYWPTEYRNAACAVLASALWHYKREHCMPEPVNGCATHSARNLAVAFNPAGSTKTAYPSHAVKSRDGTFQS